MSAAALKERLRADLKAAMQARATGEVRVLRTLIAALDNAEAVAVEASETDKFAIRRAGDPAVEVARRELGGDDVAALLAAEIDARRKASAEYRQGGRAEESDALLAEIELIARYL